MKNVCLEQVSVEKREKNNKNEKKIRFQDVHFICRSFISVPFAFFLNKMHGKQALQSVARDAKKKLWKRTNSVFAARLQCFDIKMLLIILKLYVVLT